MKCLWRQKSILIAIILLVVCSRIGASDPVRFEQSYLFNTGEITNYFEQLKSEQTIGRQLAQAGSESSTFDIEGESSRDQAIAKKKNPHKAFLYSLIIPGTGQLYTGSKIKALLFFSVEAVSWYGYATYQSNGDDKTALFEAYADERWSRERYAGFLITVPPEYHFTHELPETNTQQYYEMIGKYDQFVYGWDDTTPQPAHFDNLPVAYSEHRLHYEDMRHEANQEYSKSTRMIMAAMLNHLASAFEAALAAKRHNNRVKSLADRLSFKARLARMDHERVPILTISYKF